MTRSKNAELVTATYDGHAAEQRHFATDACKGRQWDECEKALNRAKEVDPEGETSDEVKGMREAIEKGCTRPSLRRESLGWRGRNATVP